MGAVRGKKISRRSRFWVSLIAMFAIVGIASFGITIVACKIANSEKLSIGLILDNESQVEPSDEDTKPTTKKTVQPIDFQPVVDEWLRTVNGTKSVLIYDLDSEKISASYNIEEDYNTASLYKLFVVYEGYKRVASGDLDGGTKAGSTGKTVLECLDLAIRESNSPCAETLWSMIGRGTLNNIIEEDWKITGSNIPELISNANDIMLMMKRFYEHPDFDDATLLDKMLDSFLNQPKTTYDWRQGLPSGFTEASVYNKVGWDFNPDENYWNIYHDAAIIKFPLESGETRDFIVVVMTNRVDFKNIRKLGKMLEDKFYEDEI